MGNGLGDPDHEIVIDHFGAPAMAAPRQCRSDLWKPRACVLRYRAWRDVLKAQVKDELLRDVIAIGVHFKIRMPDSWSQKKMDSLDGKFHRQKPDEDNLLKGVKDALILHDEKVALGLSFKTWTMDDDKTTIWIWRNKYE